MTLLEVVIAVVILSLGVVAVMSGLTLLAASSSVAHERADVGAALRSAMETLENSAASNYYQDCTKANPVTAYTQAISGTPLPQLNGSPDVVAPTVIAVNGPGAGAGSLVNCSSDPGLQVVGVSDSSVDRSVSETLWMVKRVPS